MRAWFLLLLALIGTSALAAGLTSVEINGNSYTNITKVYAGAGGKIIILYPGGGTSATMGALPPDFLTSWGIGQEKQEALRASEADRAAQDLDRAIKAGCFREVDGVVYDTRKAQSGWVMFRNVKMFQIVSEGALINTTPGNYSTILPIFVRNLPDTLGDQDFITFVAYPDGTYSYINKVDDGRTVRAYDFGHPCSREKIPEAVLTGKKAFEALAIRDKPQTDVIGMLPESADLVASGSGFFVSTDGYFITNDHVVENARRIKVKLGGMVYPATVVRRDAIKDLALLKITGEFKALGISSTNATLGQAVFTIGFPDIKLQGTEPKYTDGKVSSLAGLRDDPLEYQISVPVQPGNSGGPLVDEAGNVRGVIVAQLNNLAALRSTGSLPQNVNYAVKGSALRDFLGVDHGITLARENTVTAGAVDRVREAVGIVLVY